MYALKKPGNKLGYWLFFFLSFHWTNYRVLKTAEFPSSINLSLDYFTAAAYLPVALLLCGSNCCLALRWNASENRFFPIKLSPSKLPLQKPSAALSCPPIAMICHPNNFMPLSQRRKDCWNKSPWIELYRILLYTTDRENRLPRMTLDFFPGVTECWKICGDFFQTRNPQCHHRIECHTLPWQGEAFDFETFAFIFLLIGSLETCSDLRKTDHSSQRIIT